METAYEQQLCEWIGSKKSFTLLYQASRDGCSPQVFHQKCDQQGPTVTVCYNTAGYVFGGYTAVSWTGQRGYKPDPEAFLFRLAGGGYPVKKYVVKQQQQHSVVHNSACGPVFGDGHDLYTFQGTVERTQNYFQGNGQANIGISFDLAGDTQQMFTGNNLQYTDIKVFLVADSKEPPVCEAPWRKLSDVSLADLKSQIETYTPPDCTKVKAINLLLLGPVGAGKSSFFNSVNSIFQGEITMLARCGSAERSLTTTYRRYRVRSRQTGETIKLRLCDTRGLEPDGGLDLVDLMAVVEGHVPDRFQFTPTVPINSSSTGYNSSPSTDDKIHCVAYVIDGTAVDIFPQKVLDTIKSLQLRLNPLGINDL